MNQERSNSSAYARWLAVAGGAAALVMGSLTIAGDLSGGADPQGGWVVSDPGTFTEPTVTEMTTGETTKTSSEVQGTETARVATPAVTATTPEPPS